MSNTWHLHDVLRATKKCAELGISQYDSSLLELTNRKKGFMVMLLPEYFYAHKVDLNMHRASSKHFQNKNYNLNDFGA
jgi:hypothetical protein